MSGYFIDGATKRVEAPATLDEPARAAEYDRLLYHDGEYGSTIGIEGPDGNRYCVGCWWCEGPLTEAHGWML